MTAKLLSVVIPSYNCAKYVAEAICSVLEQSYRPIELIVVDDGSTDASRVNIRGTFATAGVDNLVYLEQENQGGHAAIMRGLNASHGELLSILNCDDFYAPERFTELVPRLEGNSSLAFSELDFVDSNSRKLSPSEAWPAWYANALCETEDCLSIGFGLLLHNFSVTSGNFLFTRDLYAQLGGFSEQRFTHDWDFLMRSIYFTEPVFVRKALISYRIHEANTTESVRHLLLEEATDVIRRLEELYDRADPPNTLAPCRAHWPQYFQDFIASRSPFFAPEQRLADFFP